MDDLVLLRAAHLSCRGSNGAYFDELTFELRPGLSLVVGDSEAGRRALFEIVAGVRTPCAGHLAVSAPSVFWEGALTTVSENASARAWFGQVRDAFPTWNDALAVDLIEEIGLDEHLEKALYMLSQGSRRKLGVVAAFACGASLALLDAPFAALDARSSELLNELFAEASEHPSRGWVISDYEVPAGLSDISLATTIPLRGKSW